MDFYYIDFLVIFYTAFSYTLPNLNVHMRPIT